MLMTIIPFVLLGIAFLALVVLAVRKLPYLRALDPKSAPEAKEKDLKHALMAKRLARVGEAYMKKVKQVASPLGGFAKQGLKKAQGTISSLEEHYQKLKKESATEPMAGELVKKLLDEARQLTKEERYGEAEKRYIEVLSHDSKNVEAYEDYAEMLIWRGDIEQARETLLFILKIRPDDASVNTRLGEIELMEGNPKNAKDYFEKAIKKRANNPKYLDFFVEASIQAEAPADARRGLKQLREVNPDNQKLAEFEERIKQLVGKPKEKSEDESVREEQG